MFRVFGTITFAAVLGLSTSAMGQTAGTLTSKVARAAARHAAGTRKSTMPVRALLRKHVEKVDWVEVTFEEVLEWLRGMADDNVNIVPRWTALNAVGVDTDSPVTLNLKDTTVAEVLNAVGVHGTPAVSSFLLSALKSCSMSCSSARRISANSSSPISRLRAWVSVGP